MNRIKDFIISAAAMFVIIWTITVCLTIISVNHAESCLPQITQHELLRFKIYGSSSSPDGNTISAAFSIVDSNGNELAAIERSWTGNYLTLEFAEACVNGRYFLFPSRIYGKERIIQTRKDRNKGTMLEKYYDDNHQCLLLGFGSTLEQRQYLYKIAKFATGCLFIPHFGMVTPYSLDLSECKIEVFYSVERTPDGKIYIREL